MADGGRGSERTRSFAGKVPPHDLEAEAAVLSAIMLKRHVMDEVSSVLRSEHFYSDANAKIFEACTSLASEGSPLDTVQIGGWLRDREQLGAVGGLAYLAQIVDATPAVAHVSSHALTIVRKARRRRAIDEAHRILAEGYTDCGDEDEWLDGLDSRFSAAVRGDTSTKLQSMREVLAGVWTEITEQLGATHVKPPGGRFGLSDLDDLLGPLRPGRVSVVGGFWGDGKSALGFQAAIATSSEPDAKPETDEERWPSATLVVSVEMGAGELAQRGLFLHARVDSGKSRPNHLHSITETEWKSLTDSAVELTRLPLWFDDRADMTPELLRSSIRRHKAEALRRRRVLRLVVVDYLQILEGGLGVRKNANREQEVAVVARALKRIAKAENVHILALAQLNDDPNKRGKDERKPTARDFRESKAIPMNADIIVLIHNPFARERVKAIHESGGSPPPRTAESVELIVDKLKGGRTGTVRAAFWPHLTLFADAERGSGGHYS